MSAVTCPNGHESVATDYCDLCGAPIAQEGAASAGASAGASAAGGASGAAAPGAAPGAAPDAAPEGAASSGQAPTQECPNCGTDNDSAALFCEACGYDFTTGTMPRPAEVAPTSALDLGAGVGSAGPPPDAQAPDAQAPDAQAPVAPEVSVGWVVEVWVDPDWYASQESDDPCPSPGLPETLPLRRQSLLIGRPSVSRGIHPDIDLASDPGVSRRQAQLTTDGSRWWVEDLQSSNGTYVGSASGPLPENPVTPGQRRELAEGDRVYVGAWTRLVVRRATAEEQAL